MAETAAHLVEHVIPRVPVRQWVLSFPIPLRWLFAAHPELLAPVLRIVHRVIATFLIQQAGLQRTEAHTGAVTLIQCFGSAANLNIHLHCLVLDGVYRTTTEGLPIFHTVHAPTATELQALLNRIIKRMMKFLTRKGYLIEEQGMTYLTGRCGSRARTPASGGLYLPHRARAPRGPESTELANRSYSAAYPGALCQRAGLSLHAEVCCAAHQRKKLEHLCRYITRPAFANERLRSTAPGSWCSH